MAIYDTLKESVKDKVAKEKNNKEVLREAEDQMFNSHSIISETILKKFDDASINTSYLGENKFSGSISISREDLFDSLILAKFYLNKDMDLFNKVQRFQKLLASIAIFKLLNKYYGTKNYTKLKKIISRVKYSGKEYLGEAADDKIDNEVLNAIKEIASLDEKQKFTVVFTKPDTDQPWITDLDITFHDYKLWFNFRGAIPEEYYTSAAKEEEDDEDSENPFNKIRATIKNHHKRPLSSKDKDDIVEAVAKSFGEGVEDFKSRVKVLDLSTEDGIKEAAGIIDRIFDGFPNATKKFNEK